MTSCQPCPSLLANAFLSVWLYTNCKADTHVINLCTLHLQRQREHPCCCCPEVLCLCSWSSTFTTLYKVYFTGSQKEKWKVALPATLVSSLLSAFQKHPKMQLSLLWHKPLSKGEAKRKEVVQEPCKAQGPSPASCLEMRSPVTDSVLGSWGPHSSLQLPTWGCWHSITITRKKILTNFKQ